MKPALVTYIHKINTWSCILILISFYLYSCNSNEKVQDRSVEDSITNRIHFPVQAKNKNSVPFSEDTDSLFVFTGNAHFLITPKGELHWGNYLTDSIHLQTGVIVEKAFLYKVDSIVFIFYTETDNETAASRVEKIDLSAKKSIWKTEIPGFNLGIPYLLDNFAYLTTIGTVGKLNLDNGKYDYQFQDLYDNKKYSFNNFDTILFRPNITIFLSENDNRKRIDSIIVEEKTKKITILK